jgi:glycosyltransferase involved in cell wall biosynthesis
VHKAPADRQRRALIIHPRWAIAGGGEYICINIIQTLRDLGYDVTLMAEDYDADLVSRAYGLSKPPDLKEVVRLEPFKTRLPKFLVLQRTLFYKKQRRLVASQYSRHQVIFHSQTAYYLGSSGKRTFNIFYDPLDFLLIEQFHDKKPLNGERFSHTIKPFYYWLCRRIASNQSDIRGALNIPLASILENYLRSIGYRHSHWLYPPCNLQFKPREKLAQVIQVTRIAPRKRLEDFAEIARRMPNRNFVLVVSVSEMERRLDPGYAEKVIAQQPSNVQVKFARLVDCPELLEQSRVYLYTSLEPGVNISTAQACGAGCIPITPSTGGGSEIVSTLGAGYTYDSLEAAIAQIEEALDNPRWTPNDLSLRARIFASEHFRERLSQIVVTDLENQYA